MIECLLLIAGLFVAKIAIKLMIHGINISLAIAYRLDAMRRKAGNEIGTSLYHSEHINSLVKAGVASATSSVKVAESSARILVASAWVLTKIALRGILFVMGRLIDALIFIVASCFLYLLIWDAILLVILAVICGYYQLIG